MKVVASIALSAIAAAVAFVLIVAACDPDARACPKGKQLIIVSTGKVTVINCV